MISPKSLFFTYRNGPVKWTNFDPCWRFQDWCPRRPSRKVACLVLLFCPLVSPVSRLHSRPQGLLRGEWQWCLWHHSQCPKPCAFLGGVWGRPVGSDFRVVWPYPRGHDRLHERVARRLAGRGTGVGCRKQPQVKVQDQRHSSPNCLPPRRVCDNDQRPRRRPGQRTQGNRTMEVEDPVLLFTVSTIVAFIWELTLF